MKHTKYDCPDFYLLCILHHNNNMYFGFTNNWNINISIYNKFFFIYLYIKYVSMAPWNEPVIPAFNDKMATKLKIDKQYSFNFRR